jgi:hypothetical protein
MEIWNEEDQFRTSAGISAFERPVHKKKRCPFWCACLIAFSALGYEMRKIIFLDIDGTLCNDSGAVPASAENAIKQAHQNGATIIAQCSIDI